MNKLGTATGASTREISLFDEQSAVAVPYCIECAAQTHWAPFDYQHIQIAFSDSIRSRASLRFK
jgi:hypothetical protein